MFSFSVRYRLTQGIYNISHAQGTYNWLGETKYQQYTLFIIGVRKTNYSAVIELN